MATELMPLELLNTGDWADVADVKVASRRKTIVMTHD